MGEADHSRLSGAPGVSTQFEGRRLVANSLALASSLVVTFVVATLGQIAVRRTLGADRFGTLSFVESVSLLAACIFSLGVDGYIRREVAIRPTHALEFARPLDRLRIGIVLAVATVCALLFAGTDGPREQITLVFVYVVAQGAVALGQTGAAYMHAVQRVGGLTISSIVTKLSWLGLLLVALLGPSPLFAAPLALLISETGRNIWLRRLFHRHIGHPERASVRSVFPVVRAASPFYVDSINLALTNNVIPTVLGLYVAADDHAEVGFLSTAQLALSAPLFAVPILIWVLNPLFARLHQGSPERMWRLARTVVDRLMIPTSVAAVLTAAIAVPLVTIVFGDDFRPTALPLIVMAVSLPLTYVAVALAGALIADGRAWEVTRVNLVTMTAQTLSAFMVFPLVRDQPDGHPAMWGAAVLVFWEVVTVIWLWRKAHLPGLPGRTIVELLALCAAFVLVVVAEFGTETAVALSAGLVIVLVVVAFELPRTGRFIRQMLGAGALDQ